MRRRTWETVQVLTPAGPVEAAAPVIVSASRATDIPALYGEWLLRRLRAGWCARVNRFSGRREHVSFERARVIVFWSKNPAPLIPRLGEIDALRINHYFSFTLNDYEREGLEPGLPPLEERIETFRRLSGLVGRDRVVWRFDPILTGRRLGPEAILERIARIGGRVHAHTRNLVVSFADLAAYPAVRRRLAEHGPGEYREPAPAEIARIAEGIRDLNRGWGLEVGACAETVDLARYGIGPNRCIDDRLMARAFPGDAALLALLGRGARALKDRGQRPACGCIVSRDIGRYGTCPQGCAYCYANVSHPAAAAAHARHDPDVDCL
jgi:DNA repair photolyase